MTAAEIERWVKSYPEERQERGRRLLELVLAEAPDLLGDARVGRFERAPGVRRPKSVEQLREWAIAEVVEWLAAPALKARLEPIMSDWVAALATELNEVLRVPERLQRSWWTEHDQWGGTAVGAQRGLAAPPATEIARRTLMGLELRLAPVLLARAVRSTEDQR